MNIQHPHNNISIVSANKPTKIFAMFTKIFRKSSSSIKVCPIMEETTDLISMQFTYVNSDVIKYEFRARSNPQGKNKKKFVMIVTHQSNSSRVINHLATVYVDSYSEFLEAQKSFEKLPEIVTGMMNHHRELTDVCLDSYMRRRRSSASVI